MDSEIKLFVPNQTYHANVIPGWGVSFPGLILTSYDSVRAGTIYYFKDEKSCQDAKEFFGLDTEVEVE